MSFPLKHSILPFSFLFSLSVKFTFQSPFSPSLSAFFLICSFPTFTLSSFFSPFMLPPSNPFQFYSPFGVKEISNLELAILAVLASVRRTPTAALPKDSICGKRTSGPPFESFQSFLSALSLARLAEARTPYQFASSRLHYNFQARKCHLTLTLDSWCWDVVYFRHILNHMRSIEHKPSLHCNGS